MNGYIASEANHTTNIKHRNQFDKIFLRAEKLLNSYTDEEDEPDEEGDDCILELPEVDLLVDDINAKIDSEIYKYENSITPVFGGLTFAQVQLLVQSDWESKTDAIQFNEKISLSQLKGSMFLNNARIMLSEILKQDGVKLTKRDNLNQKFVRKMYEELAFTKEARYRMPTKDRKVINEEDCFDLHIQKTIILMAGVVRNHRGFIKITNKGKDLLEEENAGKLFSLLFKTFFRKFNVLYLTIIEDFDIYQNTIAYPIYMSGKFFSNWTEPDHIGREALLPDIWEESQLLDGDNLGWLVNRTVFDPLSWFGLLEKREISQEIHIAPKYEIRKSPLYDEFLTFNLTPPDYKNYPPSKNSFVH
ncbi:MAG: hypothetical protein HOE64_07765 [Nitrospina sp.]|nr:hypothetical protein [Nitrospina sp.]